MPISFNDDYFYDMRKSSEFESIINTFLVKKKVKYNLV